MNEIEFRNWLIRTGTNSKVAGDLVSRLKRIEKEIKNCDIDEQYRKDKCKTLLTFFLDRGNNTNMQLYSTGKLPVGKSYISAYKYALMKYISYCEYMKL